MKREAKRFLIALLFIAGAAMAGADYDMPLWLFGPLSGCCIFGLSLLLMARSERSATSEPKTCMEEQLLQINHTGWACPTVGIDLGLYKSHPDSTDVPYTNLSGVDSRITKTESRSHND